MSAIVLKGGGVSSDTNQANSSTFNYYYSFSHDLPEGSHGASLSIDAITGGNCTIQFSNDTLVDSNSSLAGIDENNATAAQLNGLTWVDRTTRFSAGGTATITATQVIDFDTNISYRFMRVQFNTTNATNSLTLRYRRK